MSKIDMQQFGGKQPKVSPRLLRQYQAQTAKNCKSDTGKLVPVAAPAVTTDHGVLIPKTIWKMKSTLIVFPNGEENTVVDSSVDDTHGRIFWTDGSLPKQSDDDTLWGETTWWRRLGVKAPTIAPTVTISGVAGDDVQDYVSYVYTMVSDWGEESAPSPATSVATIMSNQYVDLSVMPTPTDSYNDYTYKRIYRLSSGTQGAEYQYLGQTAYGNTTYQDKSGSELADVETDVIDTEGWVLPPDDLQYLTMAHNGIMVGASGKELYMCEPNYYYAWPVAHARTFDTDIQGVGAFNQYIVVITKKYVYVLTGSHPLNMTKSKMGNAQSCENARGVVSTEFGVMWPSPDGLCLCNGQNVRVLSKDWISKSDWQTLGPETLIGTWFDDKYYGFFSGTDDGIIYNIQTGEYVTTEFASPVDKIYDAYPDLESEKLYILCTNTAGDNGYTYEIEAGSNLTYTWKSKEFVDSKPYTCVKIDGNFGASNVTFKWYEDGVLKQTVTVSTTTGLFRLPDNGYSQDKAFQLEAAVEVYRLQIATSPGEID